MAWYNCIWSDREHKGVLIRTFTANFASKENESSRSGDRNDCNIIAGLNDMKIILLPTCSVYFNNWNTISV